MPLEPWRVASEPPPAWLGEVSTTELERLRGWAATLRIRELWFSEESNTLTGHGVHVAVSDGERIADAFRRLLRSGAERQLAEREAGRDRQAEAHETLKRLRGKPHNGG